MTQINVSELDAQIVEAIRSKYGYTKQANRLINHFYYTLDDAESYYGSYNEERYESMYTGDFYVRTEDLDEE